MVATDACSRLRAYSTLSDAATLERRGEHRYWFIVRMLNAPSPESRTQEAVSMPQKRAKSDSEADDVIIKKYANRRLYNTSSSSYVTLDDLRKMVQENVDFRVIDAKTNDDLTRSVLTQIIVEEESRGQNLLPISFLRQIIAMYEDNMRWTLPQYLETAMGWYARHQQEVQRQVNSSFGGMMPSALEEMQRQQLALFDQAVRMFQPGTATVSKKTEQPTPQSPPATKSDEEISDLRERIAALQEAVETLAKKGER